MGRIQNILVITVLLFPWPLQALNLPNDQFPNILAYLNKDNVNLVVVDLDNTLMASVSQLSNDPYRSALEKKLIKQGFNSKQAQKKAQQIWAYLQTVEEVRPMESGTVKTLHQIQSGKISLMGITSRDPGQAQKTQAQLKTLRLDLSVTAPPSKNTQVGSLSGVQYLGGILYTGSQIPAGKALEGLLNQSNFIPQVLIYVDDENSRITSVFQAIKKLPGINFTGIHYEGFSKVEAQDASYLTSAQKKLLDDSLKMPKVQQILKQP